MVLLAATGTSTRILITRSMSRKAGIGRMWSEPYHGVQHLGEFGTQRWWVTVEDHCSWATLNCWFPGCAFSPQESSHTSAAEARAVGEKWLQQHDPESKYPVKL